ncbi:GNAT family N-acetyltransferase [Streptomyces sp. NPDC093225]|uniref:GNAT family N-acetyltransferase n=1 Tax=Streptomyces sp. NPDC093225 TaxID=3366034 RepID=UPI0038017A70
MIEPTVRIRAAREAEAAELSALALRSKGYWGYDPAFLAACAEELRIRPGEVAARRVRVAEDGHGVLGLASLEDEPTEGTPEEPKGLTEGTPDASGPPVGPAPDGRAPRAARLGLLFVAPEAVRRGVGRALYRDALARARELGFGRLRIASDPHAAPFYAAMGARPAGRDGALPRFEVELRPEPAWVGAWTGGRRGAHIGNVAEYNAQFATPWPRRGGRTPDHRQRAAHHYSGLAAFHSPHPAALLLPLTVPRDWLRRVSEALEWEGVELYDGLAEDGRGPSAALTGHPRLAAHLREAGLPLLPWGRTGPGAALRYESKSASSALFHRLAADGSHPGVRVPRQWYAPTRRAAALLLRARARSGADSVLKSDHGVGGSGTAVVPAELVRAPGGARRAVGVLPRGPLLVEEYVPGWGEGADLTWDGFVAEDGRVHAVGTAVMDVAGTAYRGATVGPGAVPRAQAEVAAGFGMAVGRELASDGYRGWFDVDFVAGADGLLAPTETNLRLTGPSVAFMVKARLDALRGGEHLVRIMDQVPLGARLPEADLMAHLDALAEGCERLGAVAVPAIATAAFEPAPFLGMLLAARTWRDLEAADDLVREESAALRGMFGEPELR